MKKCVLISGARIAGPALAFWLKRYGFDVTVVERAPGLRPGGYAVDFRGTAMRVLERMGLIGAIKEHETRAGSITMVDKENRLQARLPDGSTSGDLEIMRGDLSRVLYDATRTDTEYLFDDEIRQIRESGDGVDVNFASGIMRRFDYVVGAEGLHSNVSAIAFGNESEFTHPMGTTSRSTRSPIFSLWAMRDDTTWNSVGALDASARRRMEKRRRRSILRREGWITFGAMWQRKRGYCARPSPG